MPLDSKFRRAAFRILRPQQGTELMAELLYSLVRSTRPSTCLEVGAGYTSPFLLQALRDNGHDFQKEWRELRRQVGQDLSPESRKSNFVPDYYLKHQGQKSTLYSIDDLSYRSSSARQTRSVVRQLKLEENWRFLKTDFGSAFGFFHQKKILFDFVWFDCGGLQEYSAFLQKYWALLNPDGGILVLHSTLTNSEIQKLLRKLKSKQLKNQGQDFELLSLLEPHKSFQNSCTLIRKTSQYRERTYTKTP